MSASSAKTPVAWDRFKQVVSAIAGVPKAEVDAEEAKRSSKPRIKPGPKPGTKPKRRRPAA
jgi:hypothetical protein